MLRLLCFAVCFIGWGVAVFLMTFVTRALSQGTILVCNLLGYGLVIAWFAKGADLRLSWAHALAVFIGVLFVFSNLAYYKLAAMGGQASVLAPLTGLYVVVASLLGVGVLGEPMTLRKGLGIVLAGVAIFLLSSQDGQGEAEAAGDSRGPAAADSRTVPD